MSMGMRRSFLVIIMIVVAMESLSFLPIVPLDCSRSEECSNPVYDVVTNQPAQSIWLSHTSLQTVLLQQLEKWRQSPSTPAKRGHMESAVKAMDEFANAEEKE
jgi:hypothetical protein